jgi:hypothetical protein
MNTSCESPDTMRRERVVRTDIFISAPARRLLIASFLILAIVSCRGIHPAFGGIIACGIPAAHAGEWSLSPVVGFISGGLLMNAPDADHLSFGVKLSHRRNGTTWIDIGISRYGKNDSFLLINSRACYQLLQRRVFLPYLTTGVGLIASDSSGAFDFLIGGGLLVDILRRVSIDQSYLIHYSPSQAFTDTEGNPVNSFATSIHFWF